jgi:DNA-binding MarR family transcriptional regulator
MQLPPTQALDLWRRTVEEYVRRDLPDLSSRQMAILLIVYTRPAPHTVRGLAAHLAISKPAVTRAIDRLSALDFVRRRTDEADRRSVLVQRTVKGAVFLSDYADLIAAAATEAMPDAISAAPEPAAIDAAPADGTG